MEKLTLYLHLQTLFVDSDNVLEEIPSILHSSILTIPISTIIGNRNYTSRNDNEKSDNGVAAGNCNTSSVVHPRCHIIWNVIINFLTVPIIATATTATDNASTNTASSSTLMKKVLRKNIPMIPNNNTSLSVSNILEGIVNDVILSSLLGYVNTSTTNATTIASTPTTTVTTPVIATVTTPVIATHERRALAMLLFQKINYISNISLKLIENVVWHSHLISNLLNKNDYKKVHYLEPLASPILDDIITSRVISSPSTTSDTISKTTFENNNNIEQRLALVRSLLKANPLFDKVHQVSTCHYY